MSPRPAPAPRPARGRPARWHARAPAAAPLARRLLALTTLGTAVVATAAMGTATLGTAALSTAWPGTASAAPAPRAPRLELRIDEMTPRVVTVDGPGTLTVAGELTNTGDAPATGLKVRPQRGERLRTEGELRTALSGDDPADAELVEFTELPGPLPPGGRLPVRLSVPLRGPDTRTLALQRPGVYPLLINVNSESGAGERTRLAAVRVLLPVLGLPATVPAAGVDGQVAGPASGPAAGPTGGPASGPDVTGSGAPVLPAPPAGADPVTVLYPLADRPHRLPTGPGDPVVLSAGDRGGDELAGELADGGRLDGLLDALVASAPAGSAVRDALCLAVDPDLLRTVADMPRGYRLRAPDGTESIGLGAEAARRWLDRLRAAAAGRCVLALPFADADLVALSRAGLTDLAGYATRDGVRIVTELLGTAVRTDITWPADGLLDERALTDYLGTGGRIVVLSSDGVAGTGRAENGIGGAVRLNAPRGRTGTPVGLLADPLLTLAAGPPPTSAGSAGPADQVGSANTRSLGSVSLNSSTSPAGTGAPLSGQDLLGAIVFRALDRDAAGSSLVVAPPHRWNTTGADARELLVSVDRLIADGRLRATPLIGGVGIGDPANTPNAGSLVYPLRAGAREVPGKVTGRLRTARDLAAELRSAAVDLPGAGATTPAQVFDPVTEGLLRAASAVSRGHEDESGAAAEVITNRVRWLRSLVRVLEPPIPYALGDQGAPLPVILGNGLPVGMRVRVALSDVPGLRTEPIGVQEIPPLGRWPLRVNAQLTRSGQFSVEAKLTTVAGAPLGPASRLQLRSTAYGTITLWLTGAAGALLVILAGRRIARRLRAGRTRPAATGGTAEAPRTSWTPDRRSEPGSVPAPEQTLGPMPPFEEPTPGWPTPPRSDTPPRHDRPAHRPPRRPPPREPGQHSATGRGSSRTRGR